MSPLIIIAGNIGAGKTTLATYLAHHFNCTIEAEPVGENPYLADFYDDMSRWAFHTQLHFLSHRVQQHARASASSSKCSILDRSVYEDAQVFAPALHALGHLNRRDFLTYERLFDLIAPTLRPPDLVIYLHAPLDFLLTRIIKRGRHFEHSMTIEYLSHLEKYYRQWLERFNLCSVLTVDSSTYNVGQDSGLEKILSAFGRYAS